MSVIEYENAVPAPNKLASPFNLMTTNPIETATAAKLEAGQGKPIDKQC